MRKSIHVRLSKEYENPPRVDCCLEVEKQRPKSGILEETILREAPTEPSAFVFKSCIPYYDVHRRELGNSNNKNKYMYIRIL